MVNLQQQIPRKSPSPKSSRPRSPLVSVYESAKSVTSRYPESCDISNHDDIQVIIIITSITSNNNDEYRTHEFYDIEYFRTHEHKANGDDACQTGTKKSTEI